MLKESGKRQRESVPFTVRTADGDSIGLTYSSPRAMTTFMASAP